MAGKIKGRTMRRSIASCAAFAVCCSSSQATAGTMGVIAIPQMKKQGHGMKIITGTLAAGGTLGILIPPSLGFILYGVLTEQAVGKLFMAGILPGILLFAQVVSLIILIIFPSISLCLPSLM